MSEREKRADRHSERVPAKTARESKVLILLVARWVPTLVIAANDTTRHSALPRGRRIILYWKMCKYSPAPTVCFRILVSIFFPLYDDTARVYHYFPADFFNGREIFSTADN